MTQAVTVAPQPSYEVNVEAIDLFHIGKFLRATLDDLSRLQPTMVERVRQAALALIRQQTGDALPGALVIKAVRCRGLLKAPGCWQRRFSAAPTQVEAQGIGQQPVEGRVQVP